MEIKNKSVRGILRWTQWLLFACAFVLLGYSGYMVADSWRFQRQANLDLDRLATGAPSHADVLQRPVDGALIGRVVVDRLGISVAVVEGSETPSLAHAAGHIAGTALPGEPGNAGIAAHRDTFFRPLRNVRRDDVIRMITPHGEYRYRVVSTRIVRPDDVSVLGSDGSEVLTLVTCYPFYYVGAAPDRFIVRAERTGAFPGAPEAAALQPGADPPHL